MKVFTPRFRVVNLLDTSRKSLEFERFVDHSTSRIKFHCQKFSREYEMSLPFKLLGIDNFSKIRLKFASNAFPFLHPSVSPFLLFRSRRYGQSLENVSRPKTICTRQQKMTLDVIYPRRKFVSPPIRHPSPRDFRHSNKPAVRIIVHSRETDHPTRRLLSSRRRAASRFCLVRR